jgi:hypothetical protein
VRKKMMKLIKLTPMVAVLLAIAANSAFAEVGKSSFHETSNFKCEALVAGEIKKMDRTPQKDVVNSAVRQEAAPNAANAM